MEGAFIPIYEKTTELCCVYHRDITQRFIVPEEESTVADIVVKNITSPKREVIDVIVRLHIESFKGFFLSSLHPGFLRQLYKSFATHKASELLVAFDGDLPVGFIAYSMNTTGAYRHMLWRYFFPFVWYSFLSFLKKPSIFFKMFSALSMPYSHRREEEYVKIFSIGVDPDYRAHGVGSMLIEELKNRVDFETYHYITLETDAVDNDVANRFYLKNDFRLSSDFYTFEGRHMNKYHYRKRNENTVC